jgi:hypothetical protein
MRSVVKFVARRFFFTERTTDITEYESWCDNPERMEWTRDISLAQLLEPKHIRPDRKLVAIYTELHRLKTYESPIFLFFIQIPK